MKKLFVIPFLLFTLLLTSCDKEVEFIQPSNPKVNTINVDSGIIAKFLFRGNLVDSTIYRNDGITQNSTFDTDRFNKPNETYYSSNGFMESNNIPFNIAQTYSITLWVKMLGFTEGNALLELNKNKRYDGNPQVWMSKNNIYLSQCNKTQNKIKIGYVPDMINKWVNVTWIVSNGVTVLYVNGQRVGVSYWNYPSYCGITLTLGNAANFGSRYRSQPSNASIDDVKIYDRILSESEIKYISQN
jgi:hypothetical protein